MVGAELKGGLVDIFRTPLVSGGRHLCPNHRDETDRPLVLTLQEDDYAVPSDWYICPRDGVKFICKHSSHVAEHEEGR